MCNLIERLRECDPSWTLNDEAADEIERLRSYLRECGNRFAEYGDHAMQAGCYDLAIPEDRDDE